MLMAYDYSGFVSTFETPGRAGTAGQKIFAIHNGAADASSVVVTVTDVSLAGYVTVVKAITVPAPIARLWKVTVLPTGGTAVTKVAADSSADAADSAVTILQDASANKTSSAGALTATLPAGTQIFGLPVPRVITAAGLDAPLKLDLLDSPIKLRNNEGLVVFLDYVDATSNPTTDMWVVNCTYSHASAAGVLL